VRRATIHDARESERRQLAVYLHVSQRKLAPAFEQAAADAIVDVGRAAVAQAFRIAGEGVGHVGEGLRRGDHDDGLLTARREGLPGVPARSVRLRGPQVSAELGEAQPDIRNADQSIHEPPAEARCSWGL
jgi:hypothetical protein